MHNSDIRCFDIDTTTIRDSMVNSEKFIFEDADIGEFSTIWIYWNELHFSTKTSFFEEFLYKCDCEWSCIDWWESESGDNIFQGSDMIEMSVCDEHSFDLFCFSEETTYIWEEIIKSWTLSTTSEFETTIDEKYLIAVFDHRHIGSDGSEATDRDNACHVVFKFWESLWFVRLWKYNRDIETLETCS